MAYKKPKKKKKMSQEDKDLLAAEKEYFSKYDKASSKLPSSNIMFPKLLRGSAKLGLRLVAFLKLFIASLILFCLWRAEPKLLYA